MKSRQKGKKKGASKERVFGCDLQEHLQFSGLEVPQVLQSCAKFVEEHGVVDGIYRLSGVSSNIQKLRQEFETERQPELHRELYLQDIHCVSSLCKAYFRELPDPLLTYRLYDKFAEAVAVQLENERLVKILEVLQELPRPNHRTLEFLMRHLVHMASHSAQTNMHARNLAIVWAPNLLRSKDIEASGFNGTAAFMEVRVQSIVVEFILTHVDQLFGDSSLPGAEAEIRRHALAEPLEDHVARSLSYHLPSSLQVGDGPPQIRPYHTIIEIAEHKRKGSLKVRKWRSIFNLGRSGHETKRKLPRGAEDREDKPDKGTLRPAKSMDSLSAGAMGATEDSEGLEVSNEPPTPTTESNPLDAAEGGQDAEYEGPAGSTSEPGTPQAGRSASRVGGGRAERPTGFHISVPYNVNVPSHITSILSASPNIISNISLARLTRGLECPALQTRTNLAADLRSPGVSGEHHPVPPAPEDSLSRALQDTFSFLEDSSSSDLGADDGEMELGVPTAAEDDPGLGYLDELLAAGRQVEEFSVEPPLDDLSLDEAHFVLAPSCCSPLPEGAPAGMEESGEDVFLSANDDISPLLRPGDHLGWEGHRNLEEGTVEDGRDSAHGLTEAEQSWQEVWEHPDQGGHREEVEERMENEEESLGSPEAEICQQGQGTEREPGGDKGEDGGQHGQAGATGKHLEERGEHQEKSREHPEASGEHQQNGENSEESREHVEENKEYSEKSGEHLESEEHPAVSGEHSKESKEHPEESGEHPKESKEHPKEREENPEESGELPEKSEAHPEESEEHPENRKHPEESQKHLEPGGLEQALGAAGCRDESMAQLDAEDQEGREQRDGGHSDYGESRDDAEDGEDDRARGDREKRESGDGEVQGDTGTRENLLEQDTLPTGSWADASEGPALGLQWNDEPGGCRLSLGAGVGMRLASSLLQVQHVRSVPVVPPKPQFAKVPSALCSKIHVAPASPCPRPGRLDGTQGEKAWGPRGARTSWKNGGSLSFDAAVALARDRQRTKARGSQDCSLSRRGGPCGQVPAQGPQSMSGLGLPEEGAEPRSRLSLPPQEPQVPEPLLLPQRRSYAFETQAQAGGGVGL